MDIIPAGERIYIDVPRSEKADAKRAGAKWDRDKAAWFIQADLDKSQFAKWPIIERFNSPVSKSRYYLTIAYDQRHIARAGRAQWDKAKKLWFATQSSDLRLLEEWLPQEYFHSFPSQQDPRAEFADALRGIDLVIEAQHIIMDEQSHRVKTVADTGHQESGLYRWYFNDGHPGGYGINYRSREKVSWVQANTTKFTREQTDTFNAQITAKRSAIKEEQQQKQEKAARNVRAKLKKLKQITEATPYLIKKQIPITQDTFTDAEGHVLYIPHYDIDGSIWSLTRIYPDGSKKYTWNGRKMDCFHVINGFAQLQHLPRIVIAEGYSTASTLTEALEHSVVTAFDSGNLLPVAQSMRAKYPQKPIFIAGDDDRYVAAKEGYNPGREQAQKAAAAVGGKAIFPHFTPDEMSAGNKDFTDWNDLCVKSSVGKAGFVLQVQQFLKDYQ